VYIHIYEYISFFFLFLLCSFCFVWQDVSVHSCLAWEPSYRLKYECVIDACIVGLYVGYGFYVSFPFFVLISWLYVGL
jgi:hypothetical protein